MFSSICKKFSYLYYTKLRKMTPNEYGIMLMRESGITIGEDCRIYTFLRSNEPSMIHIGNHVTISSGVVFVTHDNSILKILDSMTDVVGRVTVGDYCFIGQNSILLLGVTLGERCMSEQVQ